MRFKRLFLSGLLVMGFVIAQFSLSAEASQLQEDLYQKARKEGGQAVLGAGISPAALEALASAFQQRFPGVKVEGIPITGGAAAARILTESRVGKPTIDVAQMTTTTVQPLLDAGLVANFDYSAAFGMPKESVIYGNRMVPWFSLTYVLAYNPNLVSKADLPKSWDQLLDPKWKGRRIILDARGSPFQYMGPAWGREKTLSFVSKLRGQDPILTPRGGPQIIEALVAGQAPLAPIAHLDRVLLAKDKGAPIDYVWLEPIIVNNFYSFAVSKSGQVHTAKLLAGWLGTDEALRLQEKHTYRGLIGPEVRTETAELVRRAGLQTVFSAVEKKEVDAETQLQIEVRKILTGR